MSIGWLVVLLIVVVAGAFLFGSRCPRCGKFFAAARGHRSTEGSSWWNRSEYQHYDCGHCGHKWKREINDDIDIC